LIASKLVSRRPPIITVSSTTPRTPDSRQRCSVARLTFRPGNAEHASGNDNSVSSKIPDICGSPAEQNVPADRPCAQSAAHKKTGQRQTREIHHKYLVRLTLTDHGKSATTYITKPGLHRR
jgi:hypothetical protein